jgi:LPXTG-site transpeptidase (sortase) family protein
VFSVRSKSSTDTVVSLLDRLEHTGRLMTMVALWLLLGATVGGLVFPTAPAKVPKKSDFHALGAQLAPLRLVIPSIHVDAPIVPIAVENSTLTPPSNFRDVGWWNGSAKIGAATGQTVITGHTVHTGGGEMDNLGTIGNGAIVKVVTKKDTVWYRETQVIVYSKAQLAQHAQDLFAQKRPQNRLVLITCTGWTGSYYTSNIVVFAEPLGVPNKKPITPTAADAR